MSDRTDFDLDAYFARIGYDGPRDATLATLRAIHARHPLAIPFENIDVLLGRPIRLDPAALQAKLVAGGRGGYCFEHNHLLQGVLAALGFTVTGLIARVQWMAPPDLVTARSHMLLRVDLPEGPYLADVGFGGLVATAPLRLQAGLEQPTPHETLRLLEEGDGHWRLQARLGADWAEVYRFTLQPQHRVDYEQANWWTATWPASLFVNNLVVSATRPGRRLNLLNGELALRGPGVPAERRPVARADLAGVLAEEFGIDLAGIDMGRLAVPAWPEAAAGT
jgi:N-hydroxyarylamine O-acetyltransferase